MFEWALIPAAFVAGILMFLAPCTLPIVPGYVAFIGGRRPVRNAAAFVVGFAVVFILLGTFAGALGALVGPYREFLGRGAGLLLILFGLTMLGALKLPFLSGEWHIKLPSFLTLGRSESSFLVGVLFALGWSPCIGPILGTVLVLASTSATAFAGALLLGVFSAGLAVPFLLTALLLERAGAAFQKWGRATQIIQLAGGALLLALGALMLMGSMGAVTTWALKSIKGYDALLNLL